MCATQAVRPTKSATAAAIMALCMAFASGTAASGPFGTRRPHTGGWPGGEATPYCKASQHYPMGLHILSAETDSSTARIAAERTSSDESSSAMSSGISPRVTGGVGCEFSSRAVAALRAWDKASYTSCAGTISVAHPPTLGLSVGHLSHMLQTTPHHAVVAT